MSWFLTKAAFIWPYQYISYALLRSVEGSDLFYIFSSELNSRNINQSPSELVSIGNVKILFSFWEISWTVLGPNIYYVLTLLTLKWKHSTWRLDLPGHPSVLSRSVGYQQNKDGKQANMVKGYNFLKILDFSSERENYITEWHLERHFKIFST